MALGYEAIGTDAIGAGPANASVAAEEIPDPVVTAVLVTPAIAVVPGGTSLQFAANVVGTNNPPQSVTWETTFGQINASGVVTVPEGGLLDVVGMVTATSTHDAFQRGTATFTVPAILPPADATVTASVRFNTLPRH